MLGAQTFTGNIAGRVTDSSGLPVPHVDVVVTEISTNSITKTVTNEVGDYTAAFLKPGTYRVVFGAKGFKEAVQNEIQLQLDQRFRLDQMLQVGAVSERVEVTATPLEVNYDSPEAANGVGSVQIENVPEMVNSSRGRSPFLLAKLLPGVVSTSSNNSNINNFSFGGGRPDTNELLIDGLPTTNPSDNTYTFTPSPDSIGEFKVITFAFSAEFGHTGGGVLMATSKQGTNEFHGSLYEYFGNRILNARSFFQAQNNQRYIVNDPGFTFGGPVLAPHYNGRNKTFFFLDLNYTDNATPSNNLSLTPTALERSGDFSQTNGGGVTIYDPATTTTDANGDIFRTQFPNNKIPASRIDPVAAKIAAYFPNPNGSFNGGNNFRENASNYNTTLQGLVRVDQNVGDNDKLFARYGRYNPNNPAVNIYNNAANPNNTSGWYDNQAGLGWTHIISPTVFNDFRVGFVQEINYNLAGGSSVPNLGLQGVSLSAFPDISMSNYLSLGASSPFHDRDRSYVFNEVLEVQRGRHSMKFGGDYRRQMYNYWNPSPAGNSLSGYYSFDSTFTSVTANPSSGWDLADLLLGIPTQTQISLEDYTYRENINSASLFFQDDFKVNKDLTVNLGLRWEWDGPYSEANNQFANFYPNVVNSQTGNLGSVLFAGQNGAPTHFMPNIYHDFLPRVGFAWNAAKNTVVRGGVGFFRLPNIGFYQFGPLSKYVQQATFQSTDGGITPALYLDQGVPAVPYYVDANGNPEVPASLTNPTSSVTEIDTRVRTPYNIAWQFGIQHQFGSWFADLGYEASKGVKLPIVLPSYDQVPVNEWANGSQALRPFPQYAGVTYLTMDGNSNYQSLQAKLEHRWKDDFVVSIAYTFSKLLDDVDEVADSNSRAHRQGVQNVYNLAGEWGIGGYDIPQRFVANFVYALPFGYGKRYGANTPVLKDVIGGWELAGIAEYQVGQPLPITQPNLNANTAFTEAQRPNGTGLGVFSGTQTLAEWFNTAAFSEAPANTLGSASRFPLHGPGLENWDMALQRNFMIRENMKLQFRGQFFNAWNHANFSNPNGNVTSPSFGAITGSAAGRVTQVVLRLFF